MGRITHQHDPSVAPLVGTRLDVVEGALYDRFSWSNAQRIRNMRIGPAAEMIDELVDAGCACHRPKPICHSVADWNYGQERFGIVVSGLGRGVDVNIGKGDQRA